MTKPIDTEKLFPISHAAKLFEKRTGKKPSVASIYRWALRGVCGRRLEHVRLGRDLFTSEGACGRFMNGNESKAVAVVEVRPDMPVKVSAGADVAALEARVFKACRKAARS
jgi:hypothetical protein